MFIVTEIDPRKPDIIEYVEFFSIADSCLNIFRQGQQSMIGYRCSAGLFFYHQEHSWLLFTFISFKYCHVIHFHHLIYLNDIKIILVYYIIKFCIFAKIIDFYQNKLYYGR